MTPPLFKVPKKTGWRRSVAFATNFGGTYNFFARPREILNRPIFVLPDQLHARRGRARSIKC